MIRELTEKERLDAIDNAVAIIRRNLPEYTYKCQDTNTVDGIYKPIDNIEWTTGFWPGELWLAYLASDDEVLTLTHEAFSRDIFAKGALKVAVWLIGKKSGFYSMQDVLS